MYYAAQALLRSQGIEVIKHSAVESAFGQYFVKTGKVEQRYHRMFIDARKIREVADYDIDEEIIEPVGSLKLNEGQEFVAMTKNLLK